MNLPDTLTDRQRQCVEAYVHCNYSERNAAKYLDIDIKALSRNLWLSAIKFGFDFSPMEIKPRVTATSILTDGDGEEKLRWTKNDHTSIDVGDMMAFFRNRMPVSEVEFPKVKNCNKNLMLEWPVYDSHHGMLAWGKETGNDYDHKISRHLQIGAGKILFQSFGKVKKTVIILGGDNQTADNRSGMTEKSGNVLDTDTRFQKMAWCSYEAAVTCIELAARFSQEVLVIVLSGNHDWHSAIHLTIQLHAHFRHQKRITIDTSPEEHRFYVWGSLVFMATHGDTPEKRIPTFALQRAIRKGYGVDPDMKLYVRMGHLHKKGKKYPDPLVEEDGVIIERFPTLAAQEAYSVKGAYTSCRATEANLFHKTRRYGSREITVGEILERYPL